MIVGFGVDLMDVARVEDDRRKAGSDFGTGVFTAEERAYCESQRYPSRHFAARFAVKEAVFKAFGLGEGEGVAWHEIELAAEPGGSRRVVLHGHMEEIARSRGVATILVSLSHTATVAMAGVILER